MRTLKGGFAVSRTLVPHLDVGMFLREEAEVRRSVTSGQM